MSGVTVSLGDAGGTFPNGIYADNSGNDSVLGGNGADSIDGGTGNDTLSGGPATVLCRSFDHILCSKGDEPWAQAGRMNFAKKRCE